METNNFLWKQLGTQSNIFLLETELITVISIRYNFEAYVIIAEIEVSIFIYITAV